MSDLASGVGSGGSSDVALMRRAPGSPGHPLRQLAGYGQRDHVRALFEAMTPAERARHSNPDVLRQVVEISLARARRIHVGSFELRAEHEFLEGVVDLFVRDSRNRAAFPRELFTTLLDWSDELLRSSRLWEAYKTCTLALDLGVNAFPDLWPWVRLRLADVEMLLGDANAACKTLLDTYRRPDRIADRNAIPALLNALGTLALQTRQASLFKRLLVERLRAFHTDPDERRAIVALTKRAHRGTRRLLLSPELSLADKSLWLTYRLCLGAARGTRDGRTARWLERCAAGAAYTGQYGWLAGVRSRSVLPARIDATLVTRAMGGIGDFLMMTPGLHALKAKRPDERIVLAIPRRYFPLFERNDDVELRDIDTDVEPTSYRQWFNLTDCPAARVESRTAPNITENRIDLFARGLGLRGRHLRTMDRRPRYSVSAEELKWRDGYLAEHALGDAFVVGVQPHTDEAYRDVPHMTEIIKALTAHARVLVLGDTKRLVPELPGVVHARALHLRQAFALAGACDVLVTPDSAFFHAAAALDVPCVGLFGPTDGHVRGHDYPRARILDARRALPCVPCWRNEATPCGLTGLRPSACLGEIGPLDVVEAVRELATAGPRRRRVAG